MVVLTFLCLSSSCTVRVVGRTPGGEVNLAHLKTTRKRPNPKLTRRRSVGRNDRSVGGRVQRWFSCCWAVTMSDLVPPQLRYDLLSSMPL